LIPNTRSSTRPKGGSCNRRHRFRQNSFPTTTNSRSSRCWSRDPKMDAAADRRRADVARLQSLCAASRGRVRIVSTQGNPPHEVVVELAFRTVDSSAYPGRSISSIRARIDLHARYPLQPPQVTLSPAVFHPNVFSGGTVCLGNRWMPTETLDLLVRRLIQIVTFDPTVINARSPANGPAASWYLGAVMRSPDAFPTDSADFSAAPLRAAGSWRDLSAASDRPADASPRVMQEPSDNRTTAPSGTWKPIVEPRSEPQPLRRAPGAEQPPNRTDDRSGVAVQTVPPENVAAQAGGASATPPAVIISCQECGRRLRIPQAATTHLRCPNCRHVFKVAS